MAFLWPFLIIEAAAGSHTAVGVYNSGGAKGYFSLGEGMINGKIENKSARLVIKWPFSPLRGCQNGHIAINRQFLNRNTEWNPPGCVHIASDCRKKWLSGL